ncbi:tripeptidyl-peptidase sed4 [Thozetella sp. PMI_491]|nr:tripeptidyl-peptidase sed4 [Thozetella sp. PMI_491]
MQALLAVLLLASPLLAATSRIYDTHVHEIASVPRSWQLIGDADKAATLDLSIALTQPRLGELKTRLEEISDIDHISFGQHLTQNVLKEYQQPDEGSTAAVVQWLRQADIQEVSLSSSWVRFNATVEAISRLLKCELKEYMTPRGARVYRATEYSLPNSFIRHVQFVYPIAQFIETSPDTRPMLDSNRVGVRRRQSSIPPACSGNINPDCLVALYNISYSPPDSSSGSTLGIAGFLGEYPNQSSLHDFLVKYSPNRNSSGYNADYNFTVTSVNGGNDTNAGSGGEALLDTFYTMAFTEPLPVTFLSTGGVGQYIGSDGTDQTNTSSNSNEPWLEFLEYLLSLDDDTLPKVLSLSYTDDEQSTPRAYAEKVCDLFMQLAARGVSVLAASGDGGASGIDKGDCMVNSGPNQGQLRFLAAFPASCPYVTSVGATGFYIPWEPTSWSSGGFSEYFEAPAWQQNDTAKYVASLNGTHDGWYNTSGRGFPDLTLVGVRYVLDGTFTTKGTSASTPVWASIISLINDKRLRNGKPVLGFLNPLLYSDRVRNALLDVTSGNIGGCYRASDGHVEVGWSAAAGWDPASGLGTPDFDKLLQILG